MKRKTVAGLPLGTVNLGPGRSRTVSTFQVPEVGEVLFIAYCLNRVVEYPAKGSMPLGGF